MAINRNHLSGAVALLLIAGILYLQFGHSPSGNNPSHGPSASHTAAFVPTAPSSLPPVIFELPPAALEDIKARSAAAAAQPPPAPEPPPPLTPTDAISARNEIHDAWNHFLSSSHDLPRDLWEIRRSEFLEQHRETLLALEATGGARTVFELPRDIDDPKRPISPHVRQLRQRRDALIDDYAKNTGSSRNGSTPPGETQLSREQWFEAHENEINEIAAAAEPLGEMNFHHKLARLAVAAPVSRVAQARGNLDNSAPSDRPSPVE